MNMTLSRAPLISLTAVSENDLDGRCPPGYSSRQALHFKFEPAREEDVLGADLFLKEYYGETWPS